MFLLADGTTDQRWHAVLGALDEVTGVTVANWIAVLAIAAGLTVTFYLFGLLVRRLVRRADETTGWIDSFIRSLLRRTRLLLVGFVAIYIATLALQPAEEWVAFYARIRVFLYGVAMVALLIQIGIWGNASVNFFADRARETRDDKTKQTTILALSIILKISLWAVVVLLIMSNLGIDVTALIAGLGIGGIAIALATQKMLGDLFASMVMMFDRPFDIGDFIIVGDRMGTVEIIGLKTTRLRALSGEQLIFSNSDLLDSRIQNFRRMTQRRLTFEFGVTYGTSVEKLEAIPGWVKEIIEATPNTRFDRAHFARFGDYAKIFAVVFWVELPDFLSAIDAQQAINLGLARKFEQENVSFAFPTQTLYLHKEEPLEASGEQSAT